MQTEDLKRKQKEREETGVSLYNLQQEVARQQATLDTYHETLSTINKERLEQEERLKESRGTHKASSQSVNEVRKKSKKKLYNVVV